jgi:predicted GNAT family N-acyltransferase
MTSPTISSQPETYPPQPIQYTIKLLPPPGPSISTLYHNHSPFIPPLFSDAMTIRFQVFCAEQGCSTANELDEDDSRSWHWVAYDDTPSHKPIACLRLVPPPHAPHPNGFTDPEEQPYVKLSRLAVLPEARGKGLARVLCDEAVEWAKNSKNEIGGDWDGLVLVHAQVGVEQVYEKLGFETDGRLGRWDEEGIEHLGMWRQFNMRA